MEGAPPTRGEPADAPAPAPEVRNGPRRRKIMMRASIAGGIVLMLVLAGVGVISWQAAGGLIYPDRSLPEFTPSDINLTFEAVAFASEDGVALVGWWMPPDPNATSNGTIVFLHGYETSKNQSLKVAPFLVAAGYGLLAFDFRAHGGSGGAYTTVGLEEPMDVRAAIDYLETRSDVDTERLAVLGFSMGAAVGLNTAPTDPRIDAVVADSSFAKLGNIVKNSISEFTDLPKWPFGPLSVWMASLRIGADVGDNQPARAAADLDRPVLLIQGEADVIVFPRDDGEVLRDAIGENAEYWVVPGATHTKAVEVEPEQYERRVLEFLGRTVASDG